MKNILILMVLLAAGIIPAYSQLQSDQSDAVWSIVVPVASSIDIDMKQCLVGDYKDSVITAFITNPGTYQVRIDTIYFEGTDKDKFYLVSRITPFVLSPGETRAAEFNFEPKSVGMKYADIKIVTQVDTLTQKIQGEGVQSVLSVLTDLVDFGKVEVLSKKDTLVYLLENISSTPLAISSVGQLGPDKVQFEILNDGGFTLQQGEKREMNLRFKPRYIGRTSGQLAFYYNGAGSPAVAQLFGTGVGGLVYVADDSAYVGEKRVLKLILDNVTPEGLQNVAEKVKARIRFESSIIAPDNINVSFNIRNDSTYIDLESKITSSNILAEIPVVAGLGSVSETSVDIESFDFYDASGNVVDMDVEKQSGVFKLLGICPEGGNRLVNTSGNAQILSIVPNPASGSIGVEVELIESGETRLIMGDILGNEVKTLYSGTVSEFGKRTVNADVSNLPSGVYTVILQTPTVRQSAIIIKK